MTAFKRRGDQFALQIAANLSDLASTTTARANLGVDSRLDASWYSIVMDVVHKTDGAITSGTAILTSTSGVFALADVGKPIVVQGAGTAGIQLASTILSVQSATQATLATTAATSVTNSVYDYGTDNTTAINTFLATCTPTTPSTYTAQGGHSATLPPGICGFTGIIFIPPNVGFIGQDATMTTLRALGPHAQFRAANPAGRLQTAQLTQLNQGGTVSGVQSGATLTVTSTACWGHDTAAGFTASGTLQTRGGGVASQTYTYTSIDDTHFYGVSGGTAGVTVPDGISLTQGDTSGSRGGMIGHLTIDGNNTAGTTTQPLALWGKIVQRTIEDVYVVNSWGDGEWWVCGQNNRSINHNVENNRGNGRVFDAGTAGHLFYGTEVTGNGRNNAYNIVFRESIASPIGGYLLPTDIHFFGGLCERGGVDLVNENASQIAQLYCGAYSRVTFTGVNIVGQRPSTTTTTAINPGDATIHIGSLASFPITTGDPGSVVIGNDLIAFTGSTTTTLTGCTGVANAHNNGSAVNWVSNSSTIIGRDDNVHGAGLGGGLRFHNCIFQGDIGNNGVQGSGYVGNYIFDFQIGVSGRAAPGFTTTGRSHVVSAGTIYLLDDTATDINENAGSIRTSAAPTALPGSSLVNWVVNAAGGVKTADQLVKVRGDRGPTTAGTPTDLLLGSTTNVIYDGAVIVDTTNTRLYYRSGGTYHRAANYDDIPLGSVTTVYAPGDSTPLTSTATTQPDPTLLFSLGASDVWHFEAWLLFSAVNTTMDLKVGWTGPTGFSGYWGSIGGTASTNNGWGPATSAATPVMLTESQTQSYGSANGTFGYGVSGVFMGDGAHTGNVTLAWSQNTSDPGALTRLKGSMLILTKAQ